MFLEIFHCLVYILTQIKGTKSYNALMYVSLKIFYTPISHWSGKLFSYVFQIIEEKEMGY